MPNTELHPEKHTPKEKRNERKSNKNTDFSSYSLHCNSDSTTQPFLQYLFVNKVSSRFKRSLSAIGKKSIPTNILSFLMCLHRSAASPAVFATLYNIHEIV